jgi:hypothetical protein
MDMEHRVMLENVCLVTRILHSTGEQEENYAREILQEQLANGWGGLTKEVEEICLRVGLPSACGQFVSREEAKQAMLASSAKVLKEQMVGLKKLQSIQQEDFRTRQGYMLGKSLEDARLEFRWRTGMLDNRANMGRRYSSKTCPHCPAGREDGAIETSHHWLNCEAYWELRAGLDPELNLDHRVVYLRLVQLHRIELEKELL